MTDRPDIPPGQRLIAEAARVRAERMADEDLCPHGFPPAQRCPYCNEETRPR